MIFTTLSIPDTSIPVLEDIATKEGWTLDETVQQIWDRYAMPTINAHEADVVKAILQTMPTLEKLQMAQTIAKAEIEAAAAKEL